ncbi:MAG: response regulator, partial [Bacteroidota bacterium]
MMPKMDGIEAAKVIRELGQDLPIIAMTANTLQEHRQLYVDAGMNDYISKPVLSEELIKVLEKWRKKS